jgi:hypothetical protein
MIQLEAEPRGRRRRDRSTSRFWISVVSLPLANQMGEGLTNGRVHVLDSLLFIIVFDNVHMEHDCCRPLVRVAIGAGPRRAYRHDRAVRNSGDNRRVFRY